MKRNIIIALLCTFTTCCAWGQINAPCFTIPVPADTPTYYTLYTIDEDSTIINLDNAPIYALAITGHAYLQSPTNSMVRIILVDNYGHEHLVFETNSLLSDTTVVEFLNAGRETLWENMINASHLIVRLRNATIEMNTPVLITQLLEESTPTIKRARSLAQSDTIVNALNRHLIARDIPWRAGRTDLAEMEYNERRMILGDENPFDNIEYYIGGYYVDPAFDAAQSPAVDDGYVEEFDWGNRHNKNWLTNVKNQGNCGACWAFASTGAIEAYLNLYYNNNRGINLSVQELISCTNYSCSGGTPYYAYNYIYNNGIIGDIDYLYLGIPSDCNNKTPNPKVHVQIDNYTTVYLSKLQNKRNILKQCLIKQPLTFGIAAWQHAVVLSGYKKANSNTAVNIIENGIEKEIFVDAKYEGQTAWLIKNSWGLNWGLWNRKGYGYIILSEEQYDHFIYPTGNISNINDSSNDIIIEDNDHDGYYTWGIGNKPAHCPEWASDVADGDDSNPMYGPMDEYGNLQEIGPEYTEPLVINNNITWSQPRVVSSNLIIPSGVTLTITSYLTMHPDAQILIQGGKLVLNGGTIRNGSIFNKGNLIIKNGGIIELFGNDSYKHNPSDLDVVNNGNTPFDVITNIEEGGFKHVNR